MRCVFSVLALLALPILTAAQEPSASGEAPRTAPKQRLTIGVALEGGGALGLAHIGVLQWLEEHHIPVDYIAGTSMGGLVGGMYATGMPPREIREWMTHMDWGDVIASQTPFQALAYRRKEDRRAFQNNLEFGLRNGFSLPGGLSSGQSISFLLDRKALPY